MTRCRECERPAGAIVRPAPGVSPRPLCSVHIGALEAPDLLSLVGVPTFDGVRLPFTKEGDHDPR